MPPGADPEKKKEVHTLSELKPAAIMSGSTGEKPVETEDKPIEVELNEIQWKYEYKEYPAFYVRAVDGDTIDLILDLGFGIKINCVSWIAPGLHSVSTMQRQFIQCLT